MLHRLALDELNFGRQTRTGVGCGVEICHSNDKRVVMQGLKLEPELDLEIREELVM